ncbi:MAG TPA: HAMP domain-containing sensor histidine kinase [Bacteroidales bacterium]|nr:HAMP domain-containing sensor histidine kinase [Bacteroidales bacterium]
MKPNSTWRILMENKTHYASAERSTTQQILDEYNIAGSQRIFTDIFGALTGIGAVIDKNRQVIYSNDEFLSLLGISSVELILGKRPGEVLSCPNAFKEEAGCGTSKACAYCGVVNTILESQDTGKKVTKEAQLTGRLNGRNMNWDLKVTSTPIVFNGETFYILFLQDISETKKRIALERIFFHDLLNSIGGLYGLLTVLKEENNPDQTRELINLSEETSRNIIEEILVQRQLRAAENGDLNVNIVLANSIELLDSVISKIGFHETGKEKRIIRSEDSANIDFETDKILLQRVLINLIKNALEETEISGTISTGVYHDRDEVTFWVKNQNVMSEGIQLQIFKRSFSTKGEGRGDGTYSIKLLTENYLKGNVSFVSTETEGTVFSVVLKTEFPSD